MANFTLSKIEAIKAKQPVFKLIKSGRCQFDKFEKEAKKRYKTEVAKIYQYLEQAANLNRLPSTKFKDITPKNEKVKEHEVKTKNLRVYIIKEGGGKIIVLGGYKKNQTKDLNKFRSIKKEYLEGESYEKRRASEE